MYTLEQGLIIIRCHPYDLICLSINRWTIYTRKSFTVSRCI